MITSGSVVIPRWVGCWMLAGTYTAEAPIGRFQMLSREKGQRSGSRPPGGPPPGGRGFEATPAPRRDAGKDPAPNPAPTYVVGPLLPETKNSRPQTAAPRPPYPRTPPPSHDTTVIRHSR